MALRSDRLWTVNAVDLVGSWVTIATVPAGERWLVKEIAFRHANTDSRTLFLRSSATDHFYAVQLAPIAMTVTPRWTILPEGSVVQAFAPALDDLRGTASGARFVL